MSALEPPFGSDASLVSWENHLVVPGDPLLGPEQTWQEWIHEELDVKRLNRVHRHLWVAGRVGNIRRLHAQKMLDRRIVVTERADMHLVWMDTTIFMKPLPPWLLSHEFWARHICRSGKEQGAEDLHPRACGFLYTYTKLVRSQNDLEIAHSNRLIPCEIEWGSWAAFVRSFQEAKINPGRTPYAVNCRWWYGELRLNRLNMVYRLMVHDMRGYYYRSRRYKNFLESNFAWVVAVFAYAVTILTAMQVVLSFPQGDVPQSFRIASRGFGLTCIVIAAILLFVILVISLILVVFNVYITLSNERREEKVRAESAC
ncbi:MAG: hypothetical protein M1839_001080 [Geoglossum umbratile]|nr:MAG: hypothetical protein M1839_001080 [Geoglossum umbratile]